MSTRELPVGVVFRNSIHPSRAATGLGVVFAAALVIAGCKEDSPPTNPEPPKAAAQPPRAQQQPAVGSLMPLPASPPAPADVGAPPADAEKTASGLAMKIVKRGLGVRRVQPGEVFVLTFASWDRAGKPLSHFEQAEITLNSLAPGWAEGLQLMQEGETRRLWIPANLTRKANVADPRPVVDITVDMTLETIGRLRHFAKYQGASVLQASASTEPASAAAQAGSASAAKAAPKKP